MTPKAAQKKKIKASNPWSTPAMQQYRAMKDSHPECVLFFRMGDFYEMFDEDARVVSKAIGLSLTQRGNGIDLTGVPFHAAENYISKLVKEGFRIAVCEQLEDPAEAKGVVKRGVTRIVTPGTLIDESLLDDSTVNLLAASKCSGTTVFVATTELSTGSFECYTCPIHRIDDLFERLFISELIVPEDDETLSQVATRQGIAVTTRPQWMFQKDEGESILCKAYGVTTTEGFGIGESPDTIGTAGALLQYVQETQTSSDSLVHLTPPSMNHSDTVIALDATTIRSLEIEKTIRSGEVEGSLLWVMQQCKTPMGKRMMRKWLCEPLAQKEPIEARQAVVGAFIFESELFHSLGQTLQSVQDVARICGRISMSRVTPRDIVALGQSLNACESLAELLDVSACKSMHDTLSSLSKTLQSLAQSICNQCVDNPPAHMRDGGLFKDGVDGMLDEARRLQRDAGAWLAEYQASIIEETALNTIKVGFNKVFGYYIEVSHSQADKVPLSFTRKQTLKNAERYITSELKDFEEKVLSAESDALKREQELFMLLCETITSHISEIVTFGDIVAQADVLLSFADVAKKYGYTKPCISDKPLLHIEDGRHPVLDRLLEHEFVANNCSLDEHSFAIITGPNMAGKSTYIRQVALITLLAHTGSYVPASTAHIGLVDKIFTRVGASDELHSGQSTFMVEMVETANILNNATPRSIVILDEIGRGTSTLDGLSLAWAIAERLSENGCRTLFATHYHELTTLAESQPKVKNEHVKIREWKDDIVFLYQIEEGKSDRSYGIHVAKIAGVPKDVVKRANQILESLSVQTQDHSAEAILEKPQMDLFAQYADHPMINELKSLNLDAMSPMDAFELLRKLQDDLDT